MAKHLDDPVDKVRRAKHRALKRTGDKRLTGSRYLWLMRTGDMSLEQAAVFRALLGQGLKVAPAWLFKKQFCRF